MSLRGLLLSACGVAVLAAVLAVAEEARATDYWTANVPNIEPGFFLPTDATISMTNRDTVATHTADVYDVTGLVASYSIAPQTTATHLMSSQIFGSQLTDLGVYRVEAPPEVEVAIFAPIDPIFTNDAARVQALDELGTHYRVFGYLVSWTQYPSYVTIIGTQDGTTLTLTSPAATLGGPGAPALSPGVPATVAINAGEALNIEAPEDLSGFEVQSTAPVAVYSGVRCTNIPVGASYCDHITEQQFAVAVADLVYPLCSSAAVRPGEWDEIRVLTTTAGPVTLTLDPPAPFATQTIAGPAGSFYSFQISADTVLTADAPVSVAQYLGKTGATDWGDPAYTIHVPASKLGTEATFFAPPNWGEQFMLIAGPAGTSLTLDGVAADAWSDIGATGYSCSAQPVTAGTHQVVGTANLGVQVIGLDQTGSYWYQVSRAIVSLPPILEAAYSYGAQDCLDSAIHFTQVSSDQDPDGWIASVTWDFGDGSPVYTGPGASHTYAVAGTYTVTVTATDDKGSSVSVTLTVDSIGDPNCPPVLQPPIDIVDLEGETIGQCFTAVDPDNDPLLFTISGIPPGSFYIDWAVCWYWMTASSDVGFYPGLMVTVTDGMAMDWGDFDVTVLPIPPPPPGPADSDADGVADIADTCPALRNHGQTGGEAECLEDGGETAGPGGAGGPTGPSPGSDAPPPDTDLDGVDDFADNCDVTPNPLQENLDGDAWGDACDDDVDGDGVPQVGIDPGELDNCPRVPNVDQADEDRDEAGDLCDARAELAAGEAAACDTECRASLAQRTGGGGRDRGLALSSARLGGAPAWVPVAALAAGLAVSLALCGWALARWRGQP